MRLAGRAVAIRQDNVDTDVLYPGPFLNIEDPELMSAAPVRGPGSRRCATRWAPTRSSSSARTSAPAPRASTSRWR